MLRAEGEVNNTFNESAMAPNFANMVTAQAFTKLQKLAHILN